MDTHRQAHIYTFFLKRNDLSARFGELLGKRTPPCAHTRQNRSSCAGDSSRMHPVPLHQHTPLHLSVLYNKPVNVALSRQFFELSQKSPSLVVQPSQKRRQPGDKLSIIQSVIFIIINVHRLTYHCNICKACFFWCLKFYVTGPFTDGSALN